MFEDVGFLGIYLLTPLASVLVLQRAGLSFTRFSIPLLFFVNYLFQAYIGLLPMFYKLDSHAVAYGAVDSDIVWIMLLLSASSLFLISVGIATALNLYASENRQRVDISALSGAAMAFTVAGFIFCCVVTAIYAANLPKIPILLAFSGNPQAAIVARATSLTTNKLQIFNEHYFNVFIRFVSTFLCYVMLGQLLAIKGRLRFWILYASAFALASSGLLLTTGKGLFLAFFVGNILVWVYLRDITISPKIVLPATAGFIAISAVLTRFLMGANLSLSILLSYVITRLTVGGLVPAYVTVDMFQKKDYLLGLSFPNPRGIFPYKQFLLEQAVWLKLQQPRDPDMLYSAPAVFWADMYANFGILGPLFSATVVGLFLGIMHAAMEKLPAGPLRAALVVWLAIFFMDIAVHSLFAYAWDYRLCTVLAAAVVIAVIDGKTAPQFKIQKSLS